MAADKHPHSDPHMSGEPITSPSCLLLPLPRLSTFCHQSCSWKCTLLSLVFLGAFLLEEAGRCSPAWRQCPAASSPAHLCLEDICLSRAEEFEPPSAIQQLCGLQKGTSLLHGSASTSAKNEPNSTQPFPYACLVHMNCLNSCRQPRVAKAVINLRYWTRDALKATDISEVDALKNLEKCH